MASKDCGASSAAAAAASSASTSAAAAAVLPGAKDAAGGARSSNVDLKRFFAWLAEQTDLLSKETLEVGCRMQAAGRVVQLDTVAQWPLKDHRLRVSSPQSLQDDVAATLRSVSLGRVDWRAVEQAWEVLPTCIATSEATRGDPAVLLARKGSDQVV